LIGDTNADIVHLEMGVYLFILFGVFFGGGWGGGEQFYFTRQIERIREGYSVG